MAKLRVYIDTSVLGGYFDAKLSHASKQFFDALFAGKAIPLLSDLLTSAFVDAPPEQQELFSRLLQLKGERLLPSPGIDKLHKAYLRAGVVSNDHADDALHVAYAVVTRSDVLVSWNFKHIANPRSISAFAAVNISLGYNPAVVMTAGDLAYVLGAGMKRSEKEFDCVTMKRQIQAKIYRESKEGTREWSSSGR